MNLRAPPSEIRRSRGGAKVCLFCRIRAVGRWVCAVSKQTGAAGFLMIAYPDGAIFTWQAEWCFFYGEPLRPLLARQKTWLEGWIPIVQMDWLDGGIRYDLEMFGAVLDGETAANTLQFVRVRILNTSAHSAEAIFVSALRHSGGDGRSGGSGFSPAWRYEMTDNAAWRDGKVVYCFPSGGQRERGPGRAYEKPFAGEDGYVPTGLYSFITGPQARSGFTEYQTDQDWENMLLLYPTELLSPADQRIAATLEAIHWPSRVRSRPSADFQRRACPGRHLVGRAGSGRYTPSPSPAPPAGPPPARS